MQKCIDALKALFKDLDDRVLDIETNLCSKVETCIRNNTWVIDAITDLINRDKIANAKFSWLPNGNYQITKTWWLFDLTPISSTTSDCTPVAWWANSQIVNKTIGDQVYPWAFANTYIWSALQITLNKAGTYNISATIDYNGSWWNAPFYIWKRVWWIATTTWVISPWITTLPSTWESYCQWLFWTSTWWNYWISVWGTITWNIWDIFEIAFRKDNGSNSDYIYNGTYPVTLSRNCSSNWAFS